MILSHQQCYQLPWHIVPSAHHIKRIAYLSVEHKYMRIVSIKIIKWSLDQRNAIQIASATLESSDLSVYHLYNNENVLFRDYASNTLASLPSVEHTHHLVLSVFVCIWHFVEFIIHMLHHNSTRPEHSAHSAKCTISSISMAPARQIYPRGCPITQWVHWIQNTNKFRGRAWKL